MLILLHDIDCWIQTWLVRRDVEDAWLLPTRLPSWPTNWIFPQHDYGLFLWRAYDKKGLWWMLIHKPSRLSARPTNSLSKAKIPHCGNQTYRFTSSLITSYLIHQGLGGSPGLIESRDLEAASLNPGTGYQADRCSHVFLAKLCRWLKRQKLIEKDDPLKHYPKSLGWCCNKIYKN